jgi:hypothetical protein
VVVAVVVQAFKLVWQQAAGLVGFVLAHHYLLLLAQPTQLP